MRLPLTILILACAVTAHAEDLTRSLGPTKAASLQTSPCKQAEQAFFAIHNLKPVAVVRSLIQDVSRRPNVYYPVITWATPQGDPLFPDDSGINMVLTNNVAENDKGFLAYAQKAKNGLWLVVGKQADGTLKGTLLLHDGPTACREEPIFPVADYELPSEQYRLMGSD